MISYSPLLCLDFYKTAHVEQYPAALTKMVSYYTPRMTRLADTEKVTMFGLQAFIQEYLITVLCAPTMRLTATRLRTCGVY